MVSIVDRLVLHSQVLPIEDELYRMHEAKHRADKQRRTRAAKRKPKPNAHRETAAILDYLDRLRNLVWELYGDEIIELRQFEDEDSEEPIRERDGNAKSEFQQSININD